MKTVIRQITMAEVEYVAHALARELMRGDEPIPDFSTRFPGRLESCLAVPFYTFGRKVFYKTLVSQAAVLFYVIIKNHPFQNGNKRIAVTTVLAFLHLNHKWLSVDNGELYNFAKWVAASNPLLKDETVKAIEKFIELYVVSIA